MAKIATLYSNSLIALSLQYRHITVCRGLDFSKVEAWGLIISFRKSFVEAKTLE